MSPYTLQPLDGVDRVQVVQDRIKDFIIGNGLQPGDKLPTEEQLAKELRVSRTAVREAYRGLQALGIVDSRQGYGRVVCDFNFSAIVDNLSYGLAFQTYGVHQAHEIRKSLESHFLQQAIQQISTEDLARLITIVERMRKLGAGDFELFREQDYLFHRLLFERSGNELALQLFEITWKVTDAALHLQRITRELSSSLADEHQLLLQAIQQRDLAAARHHLLTHFSGVEQRLNAAAAAQVD